ncbi:cysteine proteinase, partial [Gymnopus androsaceus JB14]
LCQLRPTKWINDKIVNMYTQLIGEHAAHGETSQDIIVFNSYLWNLIGTWRDKHNYDPEHFPLRHSKRKIALLQSHLIVIPINAKKSHWYVIAMNLREKTSIMYTSLWSYNISYQQVEIAYCQAEVDMTSWRDIALWQENGCDCGVFAAQYLESLSQDLLMFEFTQQNIPYIRHRMIWEIGYHK